MTIEIVDFPIENGDVPWFFVGLPGRVHLKPHIFATAQRPTASQRLTQVHVYHVCRVGPRFGRTQARCWGTGRPATGAGGLGAIISNI